jgi:hypothetical protein
MEVFMKNITIVLVVAGVLMGCKKDETTQPIPAQVISTSFSITDTLGYPSSLLRPATPFYLIFKMTNKTGIDQNYMGTAQISEFYITRNDTTFRGNMPTLLGRKWSTMEF